MSDRRPHWDDDLIDAVNACLDTSGDTITFDAYGVIAAVEDWELGFHAQTEGVTHSAECWRWHRECARTLIEQQQAANRQRCLDSAIKHPTAISSCKPWTESAMSEQLLNEVPDSYIQMKARALDAEAAIARVRDMCDTIVKNSHRFQDAWDEDPTAAQVPYGQAMVARHILQALDGERDE